MVTIVDWRFSRVSTKVYFCFERVKRGHNHIGNFKSFRNSITITEYVEKLWYCKDYCIKINTEKTKTNKALILHIFQLYEKTTARKLTHIYPRTLELHKIKRSKYHHVYFTSTDLLLYKS